MRRASLFSLLLLTGAAFKSGAFDPPRAAPDFPGLASHRGKVVVLEFGFTHCPMVCPTTLGKMQRVMKLLGEDARRVQHVFASVDPARDTPERLKGYLKLFHPSFVGIAATPAMYKDYGVTARKTEDGFDHSSSLHLIDKKGLLRAVSPFAKSAEDVAHDLRLLLAE